MHDTYDAHKRTKIMLAILSPTIRDPPVVELTNINLEQVRRVPLA